MNTRGTRTTSVSGRMDTRINSSQNRTTITRRFYTELLIGGLAAALVGCIIVNILLKNLYGIWPNLVLVGVGMLIMSLLITLVCAWIEGNNDYLENVNDCGIQGALLRAVAGSLAVAILAVGLEFVYELGYRYKGVDYQDYIFVVDDSGSMTGNDRRGRRYTALESILADMDDTSMVGIVRFADSVVDEVAPATLDDAQRQKLQTLIDNAGIAGGTNIQVALERAADLYQQAVRDGVPSAVILLSDGGAPVDVDGIAARFNEMGVSVCTMALGGGADRNLLQQLADSTGGIMLEASDASMLRTTYQLLNGGELKRCLLLPRIGADKGDVLHGIMCVLFMGILGTAISLVLALIFGVEAGKRQLLIGAAASFGGALIHELINSNGSGAFGRWLMLILFGLVLHQARICHITYGGYSPQPGTQPPVSVTDRTGGVIGGRSADTPYGSRRGR